MGIGLKCPVLAFILKIESPPIFGKLP
ncbi:MAG: hypothetical protein UW63_C0027G0007, partial [Candidatus Uhrbacteria bacterium GW2011_GWF2_44_350]